VPMAGDRGQSKCKCATAALTRQLVIGVQGKKLGQVTLPIQMRCCDLAGEPAGDSEEVEDERKRTVATWTVIAVQ